MKPEGNCASHTFEDYDDPRYGLEEHHRDALARELTAAAGVPMRDRYGFAASPRTVARVLAFVMAEPDDDAAAMQIGGANCITGEIELADGYDCHTDEQYDLGIVRALRPLIEQRRDASARGLR